MKYIKVEWNLLLKSKRFIITVLLLLMILIIYLLNTFTSVFNPIKETIIKKYISFQIDKDSEEIYKLRYLKITNDYNAKLLALNEEYTNNIENETNKIKKAKIKYKSILLNEEDIKNISLSKLLDINFQPEIYNIIENEKINKTEIKDKLLSKIIKGTRSNKKSVELLTLNKNKNVSEAKKEDIIKIKQKKNNGVFFDYTIKKEDGNVIIFDHNKMQNILSNGINFPSFFSYKQNGIGVLPGYLDLHYGIDFKTTPKTYIPLYNFNNKKTTVLISKYSKAGNKVVLGYKDNTGSERFEYLHLNSIIFKQGKILNENQKFGVTGKSGYITGPHLHFQYYKNGFYVPYDWGIDVKNEYVLKRLKFTEEQINRIIKLGKENNINMEIATALYSLLPDERQTLERLEIIVKGIKNIESQNKYGYSDYLSEKNIKNIFINKKRNSRADVQKMLRYIDLYHQVKKGIIKKYIFDHKENIENLIYFDKNLLGKKYKINKNAKLVSISKKINYDICANYNSDIFNNYNKIIKDKEVLLTENQIKNINKVIPHILNYIEKQKIKEGLNTELKEIGGNINKCDILFLELGKFYWGNNFNLKNSGKNGIFYNLSKEYKTNINDDLLKEEIKDSINTSLLKINSFIEIIKKNKIEIQNDFLLKFWLWSYNGIVGETPNDNGFVSNNLFTNKILPNRGGNEKKDGAYTMALKLYFNK